MRWFRRDRSALCTCTSCRSRFVVPVDYLAVDDEHWWIRLRCGECERAREVTVTNEEAQRYERELGQSVAGLKRLAEAIDRGFARGRPG